MKRRAVAAAVYVGVCWMSFGVSGLDLGPIGDTIAETVALWLAIGALTGAVIGRWWAPMLPVLALPALTLPSAYVDGAPDYGLGFIIAFCFLAISMPALATGVALRRR